MNLYQINAEIEALMETMIDFETGEVNEDALAEIEELKMSREEKLTNIGRLIRNLSADVDSLVNERDYFNKRIARTLSKIGALSRYANNTLRGEEFKKDGVWFKYRPSKAVEIDDEEAIPDEYKTFTTTSRPARKAIREALNAGEVIPGCHLEERMNLGIDGLDSKRVRGEK